MPYQEDCTVLSLRALNEKAYEMILEAGGIAEEAKPGQFVNVKCGEGHLLRRPISICETSAMQLRLDDISKTCGCALARVVRKELRRLGVEHHPVVFSPEEPMEPEQREAPPPGRRSIPGSLVWVPAAAGMLLCQYVVEKLLEGPEAGA